MYITHTHTCGCTYIIETCVMLKPTTDFLQRLFLHRDGLVLAHSDNKGQVTGNHF